MCQQHANEPATRREEIGIYEIIKVFLSVVNLICSSLDAAIIGQFLEEETTNSSKPNTSITVAPSATRVNPVQTNHTALA